MPYWQVKGRRPFERASKIGHAEIINNPDVQSFLKDCKVPDPPKAEDLQAKLAALPPGEGRITTIVAVDGGLTETWIRDEFPSAAIAFMVFGPLLFKLEHLDDLDREPFLGPEDMQRLKNIERYTLVLPTRAVRTSTTSTFEQAVRQSVQQFLLRGDGHLMAALAWLLFREWLPKDDRKTWEIPRCPNRECLQERIVFRSQQPYERDCSACGEPIYLADALRLYERVDEEVGAGGILAYLLTALEQLVLVHVIRSVLRMKPSLLREILFVKDGPLAFFGVTAPLYKPMRELMRFLGDAEGGPLINLIGLEKSGPFVEHAALIEQQMPVNSVLMLDNEYIYTHIVPGDPLTKQFGANTYYGAKVIFKGGVNEVYVGSIPAPTYSKAPKLSEIYNAGDVLRTTLRMRCSMYDNALVPVVLANRLVSLADVPSAEILKKFAREKMGV